MTTRGAMMIQKKQWCCLNITRNSFYILFLTKGIVGLVHSLAKLVHLLAEHV